MLLCTFDDLFDFIDHVMFILNCVKVIIMLVLINNPIHADFTSGAPPGRNC